MKKHAEGEQQAEKNSRIQKRLEETRSPRLLRLKDAARYLSVSRGTLRRLIQQGDLPVIRISDVNNVPWLIDVRALDSWIDRNNQVLP